MNIAMLDWLVLVAYLHVPEPERAAIHAKAAAAVARGGTLLLVGHYGTNIGTGAPGPTNPSLLYTPSGIVAASRGFFLTLKPANSTSGIASRSTLASSSVSAALSGSTSDVGSASPVQRFSSAAGVAAGSGR